MTDPRTPVDEFDRLAHELGQIADRLSKLEAPTGTSIFRTVATLEGLVADIQTELDTYMAGRYTNAQIDSKDSAVAGQIQPAINSTLAGNVTIGGEFKSTNAYNTDITWTRRTAWLGNDGRLGYASSAAERKTGIKPADIDPAAVLNLEVREFYYRDEIKRRTLKRINEGIDYVPPLERGLLAHEVDEAGLDWLVYHDIEGHPEGVEYAMLPVALLVAVQHLAGRVQAIESKRP